MNSNQDNKEHEDTQTNDRNNYTRQKTYLDY